MPPFERKVRRLTDDQPCPYVGLVVGYEDDERVLVAWGDDALLPDVRERTARARVEYADELTTVHGRSL